LEGSVSGAATPLRGVLTKIILTCIDTARELAATRKPA
jgi:hypothetical protein